MAPSFLLLTIRLGYQRLISWWLIVTSLSSDRDMVFKQQSHLQGFPRKAVVDIAQEYWREETIQFWTMSFVMPPSGGLICLLFIKTIRRELWKPDQETETPNPSAKFRQYSRAQGWVYLPSL
ncbi:hypothetical protein HOY80DRAFT_1046937 [Tuber brumale]|nr:hypothetical protein HOY80DRAFT_1046937 [Tuber brumale]